LSHQLWWIASGAGLAALMLAAAWQDVRTRRIPNALTLAGLGMALALRVPFGFPALLHGLEGAALAFGAALLLFALGALGGGDAKLLVAMGAFMGPDALLGAFAVVFLCGLALAVIWTARKGLFPLLLFNTVELVKSGKTLGGAGRRQTLAEGQALTIPYGVSIAAGSLLWWFGQGVRP
jgi:prepilin peptidase CpaA